MESVKIVMKEITTLREYENNPRVNDKAVDAVMNSIKAFGFKVPIIVDKDNVIVAGHTRLLASKKMGLKEVPCIVADDLTEDQVRAFRLADNKTAELAEWDLTKLMSEVEFIDMDLEQFGFSDLEKLMERDVLEDEFDETEELPVVAYAKKGDIFVLGKHRVMCGDSTSLEDVEKLVDGKQVDMIFTDPPYNVDYEGQDGMKIQNDKQSNEDFYNFLEKAFSNISSVCKKGGTMYCCHADTEGLNFRKAIKSAGFKMASCLIWVKNSLVLGRQDYHWRHEPIAYCWKEGGAHYFIDDRTQDTIWEYDKPKCNDLHPTMKPIELVGRAIKNSSRKGEIVLDVFGGSGSTLIASEQIDRCAYLMEIDEKYVDVIIRRYLKFVGTSEGATLIRDGKEIKVSEIKEYEV